MGGCLDQALQEMCPFQNFSFHFSKSGNMQRTRRTLEKSYKVSKKCDKMEFIGLKF